MPRTLLIGPAGAGKTHRILGEFEKILKTDPHPLSDKYFFLVPSAEHTGRLITVLMTRGVEGFFHRRVTTLSRLISATFGIGDEGAATNMTRYVLLREIFEKENWECFREIQQSGGFLNHMLSFIAELKESMIPAPLWRQKMNEMKRLEPDLAAKYEALAGIYEAYENGLRQKGLRDRQDGFQIFQERKKAGAFRGRRFHALWLDGFFDFSPLQLAYFQELCEMTDQVTVTLTYDEDTGRAELFEGLRPAFETLKAMDFKIEALKPKDRPRFSSPGLAQIEKNLFRESPPTKDAGLPNVFSGRPGKTLGSPGVQDLVIFEAIGIEGEVEMIARQIERLYRSGDYRFSDFAILLREIGVYDSVVRSVFARYDIPVEVHERERLEFAPMIRVLVRLLKIFREDWKRSDLIEFLKSTYVVSLGAEAKDYEWTGTLEHRAMERGIFRGREAWLQPWSETEEGFEKEKKERLGVLAALEDSLRSAKTFPEFRRTLIHAAAKTFGIFQKMSSAGLAMDEFVRRDAASWRRFESILDEIGISFTKDESISLDAFADRFFRLVELDLYPLHERDRNRVQVYSVSLARQKEYRVVFAAGLLEKKFPIQIKEDPVFSDWERRLFNGLGRRDSQEGGQLKENLPRQAMERYLFYLAVTRASEKLFLTYPRLDLEGKEALPSYYIEEVLANFLAGQEIRRQSLGRPYPELEEAVNERELEMAVMGELWTPEKEIERRPLVLALTNELLKRPVSRDKFKRAFYEVQDKLLDSSLEPLEIFKPFETSATTLEEYARCPFKYYAHRVLKLEDPEEDVNITRRGIILHRVLQNCFEKWGAKLPAFPHAEKDALKELEAAFKEFPLVTEKQYQLDLERESLTEMLLAFLVEELERLKASPLQPRFFELDFGRGASGLPALEIETESGRKIQVRGQIDRIDTDREGKAGEVLDYKRTAASAKFDKKDFEMGISLQLPLYLIVLEKFLKLKPAGAELYAVRERKKSGFYHEDFTGLFPGLSSRKIILPEAEFRRFLDRSVEFVREFSSAMAKMEMPVRPRTVRECDYCSYGPVCRIQKWQLPIIVEEIKEKMTV